MTTKRIGCLRYGWLDITQHPCQVAAEVTLALATRGFDGGRPCSPGCPVGQTTALAGAGYRA